MMLLPITSSSPGGTICAVCVIFEQWGIRGPLGCSFVYDLILLFDLLLYLLLCTEALLVDFLGFFWGLLGSDQASQWLSVQEVRVWTVGV
jgi:hypothetical protein